MIPNFPDPYPGELLFSVLARFSERMGYAAGYAANLELFGVRHGTPAIELPNRIDRLVSALPPGAIHTSDSIIQNNTLLPLYAPFLPERNRELILGNMKENGTRTTLLRSGIIAGRVRPPVFFRTCPVCDEENIVRCGETYWHRRYQLSGVQVCPVHRVFLENTNVQFRWAVRKEGLVSAQSADRASTARPIDVNSIHDRVRLHIAQSAAWLLDENASQPGLTALNQGYREILHQQGLLSAKGHIRLQVLYRLFAERCPPDLLEEFGCQLRDGGDGGWLGRLLRETQQTIAPLRHLLVLAVLNVSAKDFFTRVLTETCNHHPQTAFPCLNRLCTHFRELVIPAFEAKRTKHEFARIFQCPHCGHRSSRPADGQSVIRVVSFGALWEKKLKTLWDDSSSSLRRISADLDADARSVLKYAVQLRLEFPRRGPNRLTRRPQRLRVAKSLPPVMATEEKRRAWRQLQRKYPRAGVSELHRLAPALYTWLYRHDQRWLNENSPAHRQCVPKNDRVDWNARDAELASRIVSAANHIKLSPGRPRRVTVRSIGLELGKQPRLQKYKRRLPRIQSALKAHVESTEQFALRRIRWVVDTLTIQRSRPTRSEIMRSAGIGSRALSMPSVQCAIDRAKADLERLYSNECCQSISGEPLKVS